MLKDVVSKLDYSNFDEIALVLFGLSFLAICWGAFWLRSDAASRFGNIPIEELLPERRVPAPATIPVDQVGRKGNSE
jgi:cytochrome c oxidase cbb3-type subunit IV